TTCFPSRSSWRLTPSGAFNSLSLSLVPPNCASRWLLEIYLSYSNLSRTSLGMHSSSSISAEWLACWEWWASRSLPPYAMAGSFTTKNLYRKGCELLDKNQKLTTKDTKEHKGTAR